MSEDIEKLYKQYYSRMRSYLMSLCHDSGIVDDIAQNAFIKAMKHLDTFKGKSSVQTWLFSIARNELFRHYRWRGIPQHVEEYQADDHSSPQTTEATIEARLLVNEVLHLIESLNEPSRTIARLRLFDDLSFREIAKRVNKSEAYCRVTFFRIKNKLREEINYE